MKQMTALYMKNIKIEEHCPTAHSEVKPNVVYGELSHHTYYSSTTQNERGFNILLPAHYTPSKKYPVLYVLHGIFGDEFSMVEEQHAIKNIVGNQIAEGVAKEMIVVFPNMYASTNGRPPSFSDEGTQGYDNFINDLVNDLMPYIAAHYSILTGRENTALAGFSMGGRETLYIGVKRPDLFGYMMAIAPAPGVVPGEDSNMIHKGQMSEKDLKISNPEYLPYVFIVCCGTEDNIVGGFPVSYHKILTDNDTEHIWYTIGGANHDFMAIRSGINNFVRAIFRIDEYTK